MPLGLGCKLPLGRKFAAIPVLEFWAQSRPAGWNFSAVYWQPSQDFGLTGVLVCYERVRMFGPTMADSGQQEEFWTDFGVGLGADRELTWGELVGN